MNVAAAVQARRAGRWAALSRLQRAGLIVLAVLAVLALALWIATIVLRPHYPTPAELTARARQQAALTGGAQVFATHCAYCHMTGFGPPLGGLRLDAAAIGGFVRSGPGPMPAFPASQVSDADVAALATYVDTLPAGKTEKPAT